MASRTAGPIKTKLDMGTHVDPGNVLGKVKVMWRHLANANKTPYRGPQGRDKSAQRDKSPARRTGTQSCFTLTRVFAANIRGE